MGSGVGSGVAGPSAGGGSASGTATPPAPSAQALPVDKTAWHSAMSALAGGGAAAVPAQPQAHPESPFASPGGATAQSLDLPPRAARWRHTQRSQAGEESGADSDSDDDARGGGLMGLLGGRKRSAGVKGRLSNILQRDRAETWGEEE